jgi:type II secretory pathway component PulK
MQYNPKMSVTRIVGVVLLIAGIVLIIVGVVASRSLADSLSSVFRGRLTHQTMWYIFGGIASAVVGLLLTLGVIGRSRS